MHRLLVLPVLLLSTLMAADVQEPAGSDPAGTLRFLARHQSPDGAWHAARPHPCGPSCSLAATTTTTPEQDVLLTAEVALAFMGCGYGHRTRSRYQPGMASALGWLRAQQRTDGVFSSDLRIHAVAAMALNEAHAMEQDQELLAPATAALNALLARRLPGPADATALWGDAATSTIDADLSLLGILTCRTAIGASLPAGGPLLPGMRQGMTGIWTGVNPGWERAAGTSHPYPATWNWPTSQGQGDATLEALIMALHTRVPPLTPPDPLLVSLRRSVAGDPTCTVTALASNLHRLRWMALEVMLDPDAVRADAWFASLFPLVFKASTTADPCLKDLPAFPAQDYPGSTLGPLLHAAHATRIIACFLRHRAIRSQDTRQPPPRPQGAFRGGPSRSVDDGYIPPTGANDF